MVPPLHSLPAPLPRLASTGLVTPSGPSPRFFWSCLPQLEWFLDRQVRHVVSCSLRLDMSVHSTTVRLSLQALTPQFVQSDSDVPYINIVWFIPAAVGTLLTPIVVTSNRPPTPPSPSAAKDARDRSTSYLPNIKKLFTNK